MKRHPFPRSVVAMTLAVALGACTLEPTYVRPDVPVASSWPSLPYARAVQTPITSIAAADLGWRDFFADPALQQLIALALENNRDLRVTVLNVEAARAKYRIQRAELFPTINAGLTRTEARQAEGFALPGAPSVSRYNSATIGTTAYEIDLFGKVQSLDHAALETYFGLEETRRAAQLSLIASVADAYFTILADRELVRVTNDTAASELASFNLTQRALDFGTGTELSVRQAETALLTAQSNRSLYLRQLAVDTDALVLLLGASIPTDLPGTGGLDNQGLVASLPPDLPSSVLIQRPDVLAAEHTLVSANANIGAARAAFFPSISLTTNVGSESAQLHGLFSSGSKTWSFIPSINLPIFAGGANLANLDLAKVEKRIEVANYEKALQTAFREVADALAGLTTLDDQLASQTRLVYASQRNFELSDLRFKNGVDSYLTTLDAQRSLYTAQQGLVTVKLQRLQNLVAAYQTLGGGWNEHTLSGIGAPTSAK